MKPIQSLLLGLALACTGTAFANDESIYRQVAIATLPGSGHSWGFSALDPSGTQLYIARRENGLTLFDVTANREIQTVHGTEGANAVTFVPEYDRAYVANMDGSLSIIRLSDQTLLKRLPVETGNLNNLVYVPTLKRVVITGGRREKESAVYLLDPERDQVVDTFSLPARKLDAPIALRDGRVVIPLRDEDQVAVLSGSALREHRLLTFAGCSKPSAVAADEATQRLFVACRGGRPVLVTVRLPGGDVLGASDVGQAVNMLAFDGPSGRVLAPSGADAELRVFESGRGGVAVPKASIGTLPWAHNMVYDPARRQVYLFTMGFTQPLNADGSRKADPLFHRDTFKVLTYREGSF